MKSIKRIYIALTLVAVFLLYQYIYFKYQFLSGYVFSSILIKGICIGVVAVLAIYLLKCYILRKQADYKYRWNEPIASLILLAIFWFVPFQWINGFFDHSQVVCHNEHIVERYQVHGKGGVDYWVRVTSWKNNHKSEEFQISKTYYYQIAPGQSMEVCTKSGALGWEWVCKYGQ
jgi:hypothetical protein